MNLPNKLTLARMFMIPVYLVCFFSTGLKYNYLWAFIIFVIAALTDLLDGKIARKHGLVTTFGKLMDPLADKLLVMAAMAAFIEKEFVSSIVVIIILAREFTITSIRTLAAERGIIMAADMPGKIKAVLQMVWIAFVLLRCFAEYNLNFVLSFKAIVSLNFINSVLISMVLIMTIFSGFNYIHKNRSIFKDK